MPKRSVFSTAIRQIARGARRDFFQSYGSVGIYAERKIFGRNTVFEPANDVPQTAEIIRLFDKLDEGGLFKANRRIPHLSSYRIQLSKVESGVPEIDEVINKNTQEIERGLNVIQINSNKAFNVLYSEIHSQNQKLEIVKQIYTNLGIQVKNIDHRLNKLEFLARQSSAQKNTTTAVPVQNNKNNNQDQQSLLNLLGSILGIGGSAITLKKIRDALRSKNNPTTPEKPKGPQPRDAKGRFAPRTTTPTVSTGAGRLLRSIASKGGRLLGPAAVIWEIYNEYTSSTGTISALQDGLQKLLEKVAEKTISEEQFAQEAAELFADFTTDNINRQAVNGILLPGVGSLAILYNTYGRRYLVKYFKEYILNGIELKNNTTGKTPVVPNSLGRGQTSGTLTGDAASGSLKNTVGSMIGEDATIVDAQVYSFDKQVATIKAPTEIVFKSKRISFDADDIFINGTRLSTVNQRSAVRQQIAPFVSGGTSIGGNIGLNAAIAPAPNVTQPNIQSNTPQIQSNTPNIPMAPGGQPNQVQVQTQQTDQNRTVQNINQNDLPKLNPNVDPKYAAILKDALAGKISPSAAAVDDALNQFGAQRHTHRNQLIQYFRSANGSNIDPAKSAWCAAFVNAALQRAGIRGTKSDAAGSFHNWGQGVKLDDVKKGDVIVNNRISPRTGMRGSHVMLATGEINPKTGEIRVVDGNSSGSRVNHYWIQRNQNLYTARRATEKELPATTNDITRFLKESPFQNQSAATPQIGIQQQQQQQVQNDKKPTTVDQNKQILLNELNKSNITDPNKRAAIAAVVQGESGFNPRSEKDYSTTSNNRIRSIFRSRLGGLGDTELDALKKNPEAFFNRVYGGMLGNAQDEGYKFRGRGFFQLTGRGNYEKYGKMIGVDLLKNPDLANDPEIAAKLAIAYINDRYKNKHGSVLENVKRAVGNPVASTEIVKNNAFNQFLNDGTFAPNKQADLSFLNRQANQNQTNQNQTNTPTPNKNVIVTGVHSHEKTVSLHQRTGSSFLRMNDINAIADSIQQGNRVSLFSGAVNNIDKVVANLKARGISDADIKQMINQNVRIIQPHNSADNKIKSYIERGYFDPKNIAVGNNAAIGGNLKNIPGVQTVGGDHLQAAGYFANQQQPEVPSQGNNQVQVASTNFVPKKEVQLDPSLFSPKADISVPDSKNAIGPMGDEIIPVQPKVEILTTKPTATEDIMGYPVESKVPAGVAFNKEPIEKQKDTPTSNNNTMVADNNNNNVYNRPAAPNDNSTNHQDPDRIGICTI